MRFILAFLLLSGVAYGETIKEIDEQIAVLEAKKDSIRYADQKAGSLAWLNKATLSDSVKTFGVELYPSERDSVWVQIAFPAKTGMEGKWLEAYLPLLAVRYKMKLRQNGRYGIRRDRLVKVEAELVEVLK